MRYMLDTNICVYLIKNRSEPLLHRMRGCSTGEVVVSVVTVAELQYSVSKSQQKERNLVGSRGILVAA